MHKKLQSMMPMQHLKEPSLALQELLKVQVSADAAELGGALLPVVPGGGLHISQLGPGSGSASAGRP